MTTSNNQNSDPQTDLAPLLPREAFYEVMRILRGTLPPPVPDLPANWTRRDLAAMAAVVALRPITAAEGRMAAQFAMADCWASDCMREAAERHTEQEVVRRCKAGALNFLRESKSSLKALAKLQTERQVLDKDVAASDSAAWVEHGLTSMMKDALVPAADEAIAMTRAEIVPEFGLGAGNAIMNRHQRRETEARRPKLPRANAL